MGTSDLERLTQAVAGRAAGLALYARQWVDAATAEDVVQEALVALVAHHQRWRNFADPGSRLEKPLAWIYRTVRNGAIDRARSAARRRRREQAVAQMRGSWFELRPDVQLDSQAAEQALRQLPAEHREVVVLRIWNDLRFVEIAEILGLGVSTVHDRYNAALKQLRLALEKPCPNKTN
ncbi:MAG TPA: sigma-70 family RNA polymerase sigma factor [Lacipirellulaceae bacterium]|jgi:RNA polymerase sigma-70 factor (ECF subfamily)